MYSKVAVLSLVLAVCQAGLIALDQGHGHAVSSQSIIRHDEPAHQIAAPAHYATPILQHSAPIYQHSAPIQHVASIHHPAPIAHHSAQILEHAAPAYEHSAILQHSAPIAHLAPVVQHAAPVAHYAAAPIAVGHAEHLDHSAPAKYKFEYSVEDPHTGDHKSQHEIRDGDVVKGEYSLLQPDGSIRKVEYTADHHNGFNAVVHNSAPSVHAAPAPAHIAVHAAPLYTSHH